MATWGCLDCTTVYSVGAPGCPQCGSTRYEGYPMPKITVHGGPSTAGDSPPPAEEEPVKPTASPEPKTEPKAKPAPKRRSRSQAREKG